MLTLFRLLARLPLRLLHALGAAGGWIVYGLSARYRQRLKANLARGLAGTAIDAHTLLPQAIAEAGKTAMETPAIWFRPRGFIGEVVVEGQGWGAVNAALERGKGILFLTPHLGCFEITAQYYSQQYALTVLYRPPRKQVLEPLMIAGRTRDNLTPVPANVRGVRALLKALKRGEAVGILPDQVPRAGEGEWADFFGEPAYTMTLASRLVKATGATLMLAFAERLPRGQGYKVMFENAPAIGDDEPFEIAMNRALEQLIRRCPGQYLWAYDRYKRPKGEASSDVLLR